jgi:hypothetical protein
LNAGGWHVLYSTLSCVARWQGKPRAEKTFRAFLIEGQLPAELGVRGHLTDNSADLAIFAGKTLYFSDA